VGDDALHDLARVGRDLGFAAVLLNQPGQRGQRLSRSKLVLEECQEGQPPSLVPRAWP